MPISLPDLVRDLQPETTILLFGAGSSLPSNAPSVSRIIAHLSTKFSQPSSGYGLSEFAELLEQKFKDRRRLITELRSLFKGIRPTSGLINVPLYDWKSIYTTNYDDLVEQSYKKRDVPINVVSSSFDFSISPRSNVARLYKIHGTIEKDVAFGDNSRIIISDSDYGHASDYREFLYNSLKADLAESNLVIIGNSLSDEDLKPIITEAIRLNEQTMSSGRIILLMYSKDEDRASIYEGRGLRVSFGGIDDFFAEMAKKSPGPLFSYKSSDSILEGHPALVPTVVDVAYQVETGVPEVVRLFNGWPASYADINKRFTFDRSVTDAIFGYLSSGVGVFAAVLGASGVGKTTAIRQLLLKLKHFGFTCWEHSDDFSIQVEEWFSLAKSLKKANQIGVLFVDDAHGHLREVNELMDLLANDQNLSLCLILASTRNTWRPRVKTPNFYKHGKQFSMSKLDTGEIDRLLGLIENIPELSQIVESTFSGLVGGCDADAFKRDARPICLCAYEISLRLRALTT